MPVYNREILVRQAIENIVAQTYQNWELLLVDDASSDNTVAVIRCYIERDKRIKLLPNNHRKGPSGARNTGLDSAKGKYIAYQDSDDEWLNYHLEKMVAHLETYPELDLMTADPLRKNASTNEVYNFDKLELNSISYKKIGECYALDKQETFNKQLRSRVITTQTIVGKASLLKENRWNELLGAAEDNLHNLELSYKDICIGHMSDYHVIYWAHGGNLSNATGTHPPERLEKINRAFVDFWRLLLEKFECSESQTAYIKNNLAECYAWHLAYHCLEPQKKYKQAAIAYLSAIKVRPTQKQYYACLIKLILKAMLNR